MTIPVSVSVQPQRFGSTPAITRFPAAAIDVGVAANCFGIEIEHFRNVTAV